MKPYRGMTKDGKWVYGDLVHIEYEKETKYYISNSKISYPLHGAILAPNVTEVLPETVGQQIGSQDKNGKEIHKGDFDEDGIVIMWNQDDCSFIGVHPDGIFCLCNTEEWFEIAGNIHDNPELLKKQQ